jgi:hypothetical protein
MPRPLTDPALARALTEAREAARAEAAGLPLEPVIPEDTAAVAVLEYLALQAVVYVASYGVSGSPLPRPARRAVSALTGVPDFGLDFQEADGADIYLFHRGIATDGTPRKA